MKENDMLSHAAYDTTAEGYYEQIQDLFCGDDSGSCLLLKHTLVGAERHHCTVGTAYYLRLRRWAAALLSNQHRGRGTHDEPAQRLAVHSGPDLGLRQKWNLGGSRLSG